MSRLMVNVIPFISSVIRRCANCDKILYFGENDPCEACLAYFYCDVEDLANVQVENLTDH